MPHASLMDTSQASSEAGRELSLHSSTWSPYLLPPASSLVLSQPITCSPFLIPLGWRWELPAHLHRTHPAGAACHTTFLPPFRANLDANLGRNLVPFQHLEMIPVALQVLRGGGTGSSVRALQGVSVTQWPFPAWITKPAGRSSGMGQGAKCSKPLLWEAQPISSGQWRRD